MADYAYVLDPVGNSPANLIVREPHVLTEINSDGKRTLIPKFPPFYRNNFKLEYRDNAGNYVELQEGVDFHFAYKFMGATVALSKELFGGTQIVRELINGMIFITYQTLGDKWGGLRDSVLELATNRVYNPRIGTWDNLIAATVPEVFGVAPHKEPLENFRKFDDLIETLNMLGVRISQQPNPTLLPQQQVLLIMTDIERLKTGFSDLGQRISSLETKLSRLGF